MALFIPLELVVELAAVTVRTAESCMLGVARTGSPTEAAGELVSVTAEIVAAADMLDPTVVKEGEDVSTQAGPKIVMLDAAELGFPVSLAAGAPGTAPIVLVAAGCVELTSLSVVTSAWGDSGCTDWSPPQSAGSDVVPQRHTLHQQKEPMTAAAHSSVASQ